MLAQFKFPSPFSRAYLGSPQLLQDALARIHIGPFQTDGELLCLMFLTPVQDEPDETGVTLRPWTTFSRVLNDLYDHPDRFRSVTPSDRWLEWLQELDEQAPFTPPDKLDLMRSLWKLMEKATGLVDRLDRDPQKSLCPGEIPGHGLPDPNLEQGLPGSDPETRVERQEFEMAERGLDQTRCCTGIGATLVLAFIPGIHP